MSGDTTAERLKAYNEKHGLEQCASCGVMRPKSELAPGHAKHDHSIKGNICKDREWCEHHTHGRDDSKVVDCECLGTGNQAACARWCWYCAAAEHQLELNRKRIEDETNSFRSSRCARCNVVASDLNRDEDCAYGGHHEWTDIPTPAPSAPVVVS